jgi:hypothetical protein
MRILIFKRRVFQDLRMIIVGTLSMKMKLTNQDHRINGKAKKSTKNPIKIISIFSASFSSTSSTKASE